MAEENCRDADEKGLYGPVDGLEKGEVSWVVGDFLGDEWTGGLGTEGKGQFDLIFDYTVCLGFGFLGVWDNLLCTPEGKRCFWFSGHDSPLLL